MVKKLDERIETWPDHVGWRLSQASRNWQAEFVAAMREAGHGWFTEARASLLGRIGRRGVRQADLVERGGTTKQAVQQLLDGLEGEGIVARVADPSDRRSRMVRYTEKGLVAMRDGNRLKAALDDRYRERLGDARFEEFVRLLGELADQPAGE